MATLSYESYCDLFCVHTVTSAFFPARNNDFDENLSSRSLERYACTFTDSRGTLCTVWKNRVKSFWLDCTRSTKKKARYEEIRSKQSSYCSSSSMSPPPPGTPAEM